MTQIRVHNYEKISLGGPRSRNDGAGKSKPWSIALDQTHWRQRDEGKNSFACAVLRAVIHKDDFIRRRFAAQDAAQKRFNIFELVQSRNDERNHLGRFSLVVEVTTVRTTLCGLSLMPR